MKKTFRFVVVFALILNSCSKPKDGPLLVRIQNNTPHPITHSIIAGKTYGSILAGSLSGYEAFDQLTIYTSATVTIAADTIYLGGMFCGTPPIPMLEAGKYIMVIEQDPSASSGYRSEMLKE